jgi:hypothetical protein
MVSDDSTFVEFVVSQCEAVALLCAKLSAVTITTTTTTSLVVQKKTVKFKVVFLEYSLLN